MRRSSSSTNPGGRGFSWCRGARPVDLVMLVFTEPKGARSGVGALHLAVHEDGGLRYAGRVGTGFDDRLLQALRKTIEPRRRSIPPCSGAAPAGRRHTWVEPE